MDQPENPRAVTAVDREIGARLRHKRLAQGLSQEKLAEKLGLTFQQVQKYERGVNRVSCSTLLSIAEALESHPMDFLPEWNGVAESSPIWSRANASDLIPLIEAYASVQSPMVRNAIVLCVQAMSADALRSED